MYRTIVGKGRMYELVGRKLAERRRAERWNGWSAPPPIVPLTLLPTSSSFHCARGALPWLLRAATVGRQGHVACYWFSTAAPLLQFRYYSAYLGIIHPGRALADSLHCNRCTAPMQCSVHRSLQLRTRITHPPGPGASFKP